MLRRVPVDYAKILKDGGLTWKQVTESLFQEYGHRWCWISVANAVNRHTDRSGSSTLRKRRNPPIPLAGLLDLRDKFPRTGYIKPMARELKRIHGIDWAPETVRRALTRINKAARQAHKEAA